MHVNRLSIPLIAALSLPLLAGCSASGAASGIELLDQPATEADALPPGSNAPNAEPGTARFAARAQGFSFYIARQAKDEDAAAPSTLPRDCIIVVEAEFSGCGGLPVYSSGDFGAVQLVPDNYDSSALSSTGWEQIHRNVWTKDLQTAPSPPPTP
ncbi:hypothetical protein [Arthrobacter sp.]|uniref:hypothetical protein n=1 Tax=Arthrobacter sp. TaxID=1667 RepID=UPI003A8E1B0D